MISLPPDLYAEIASQSTRETLLQLCGCSWTWYLIAASQLYSNISWQLNGPAAVAFMHTIATNKWLGSRVYSLNIHWDEPDQVHMFSPALRNMHNLEHLRVSDLAGSCEADPACVDTLLSLKKLQSIDWRWSDSFDLGVVLDRLHPLRCIRLEWDVRSSGALERAITRSHEVLQAIYLSDYPFKDLISQLADSVVFSRLATICVDELPLSVLVGNQFPALRMIDALYIRDLGLLRDPEFLPTLRSLCLTCNYFVDDSTNLQDAEGPTYPLISLRAGRQLSFLELDMTRIHHTNDSVGDDEINKLNRYLGSFHLPKLSSLSLIVTTSAQVELVMGCLDRLLTQEHALRVLVVHTQMAWNDEAVKTTVRCLCDLAERGLLQRLQYLRLAAPQRNDLLREQIRFVLCFTPLVDIAHLETVDDERGWVVCAWTRSGRGWGEWISGSDPYYTMPWPYQASELEGEELLEYIDSASMRCS